MKNILTLKEINKENISIAGGKGANLGELFNAGFNVPEAFIVSAQAYENFINKEIQNKISLVLKNLDIENDKELNTASQRIQKLIISSKFPNELKKEIENAYKKINDFVAVRSSATTEDLKKLHLRECRQHF